MKDFKADSYQEKRGETTIHLNLKQWFDEEEGFYFFYSPSLDLTGYGETLDQAKESFVTTLRMFLEYTKKKGTLYDEFEHLGWMANRRKRKVAGPDIDDLLKDNETFRELSSRAGVYDVNQNFDLQLA